MCPNPRQNRTSSTDPALSPATHDGIRKESRLTPGGRGPDSAREPRAIHPFRRTLPARSGARLREDCVAIESWPSREGNASAQGGTPAVALESVVKRFGDVVAVDGIDLAIADGEFFSMLGPSGSGKTSTLRMIAGFEAPTEGTIRLHGRDVTGVPPFDRDVNTVFQDYALFPHMTVSDNVSYGLVVSGVPSAERRTRVRDALRMVRLEGYEG